MKKKSNLAIFILEKTKNYVKGCFYPIGIINTENFFLGNWLSV